MRARYLDGIEERLWELREMGGEGNQFSEHFHPHIELMLGVSH